MLGKNQIIKYLQQDSLFIIIVSLKKEHFHRNLGIFVLFLKLLETDVAERKKRSGSEQPLNLHTQQDQ